MATSLLFLAVNLHLLRNLSSAYLVLPAAMYAVILVFGVLHRIGMVGSVSIAYWLFLLGTLYTALISVDFLTFAELANALPRLFFLLPLPLCCAIGLRSDIAIRRIIVFYLVFISIGSLSLPLQLLTGPIPWFAQASARGGLDRYASLFGNLTAVGIVSAIGLLGLMLIRGSLFARALGILACLTGLILSLQKAAVVNGLVCVLLYLLLGEGTLLRKAKRFSAGAILIAAAGTIAIGGAGNLTAYTETVSATYLPGASGKGIQDDVSLGESLEKRLFLFPQNILHDLGPTAAVTGVGLRGMGGVMGMDYYDMAHNSYYDFLFSGGILYLAALLIMFGSLAYGFRRAIRSASPNSLRLNNLTVLAAIVALVFINLPASSGLLFHPNLSAGVWLSLGLLSGYYAPQSLRVADREESS